MAQRNTQPISRERRARLFGVDCPSEVVFRDFRADGRVYTQQLVLKNAGQELQTLTYRLPEVSNFFTAYPDPVVLALGMQHTLTISFQPTSTREVQSDLVFHSSLRNEDFVIRLRAILPRLAVQIEPDIDLVTKPAGVAEVSSAVYPLRNSGDVPLYFRLDCPDPFRAVPSSGVVAPGEECPVEFFFSPREAGTVNCRASLLVRKADPDIVADRDSFTTAVFIHGLAKYPLFRVAVEGSPDGSLVDLRRSSIYEQATRRVVLTNDSLVGAHFAVEPSWPDREPAELFVSPKSGWLEPATSITLELRYRAQLAAPFYQHGVGMNAASRAATRRVLRAGRPSLSATQAPPQGISHSTVADLAAMTDGDVALQPEEAEFAALATLGRLGDRAGQDGQAAGAASLAKDAGFSGSSAGGDAAAAPGPLDPQDSFNSATVTVTSPSGVSSIFTVHYSAVPLALDLSESKIDFGAVRFGESVSRVLEIKNPSKFPCLFEFSGPLIAPVPKHGAKGAAPPPLVPVALMDPKTALVDSEDVGMQRLSRPAERYLHGLPLSVSPSSGSLDPLVTTSVQLVFSLASYTTQQAPLLESGKDRRGYFPPFPFAGYAAFRTPGAPPLFILVTATILPEATSDLRPAPITLDYAEQWLRLRATHGLDELLLPLENKVGSALVPRDSLLFDEARHPEFETTSAVAGVKGIRQSLTRSVRAFTPGHVERDCVINALAPRDALCAETTGLTRPQSGGYGSKVWPQAIDFGYLPPDMASPRAELVYVQNESSELDMLAFWFWSGITSNNNACPFRIEFLGLLDSGNGEKSVGGSALDSALGEDAEDQSAGPLSSRLSPFSLSVDDGAEFKMALTRGLVAKVPPGRVAVYSVVASPGPADDASFSRFSCVCAHGPLLTYRAMRHCIVGSPVVHPVSVAATSRDPVLPCLLSSIPGFTLPVVSVGGRSVLRLPPAAPGRFTRNAVAIRNTADAWMILSVSSASSESEARESLLSVSPQIAAVAPGGVCVFTAVVSFPEDALRSKERYGLMPADPYPGGSCSIAGYSASIVFRVNGSSASALALSVEAQCVAPKLCVSTEDSEPRLLGDWLNPGATFPVQMPDVSLGAEVAHTLVVRNNVPVPARLEIDTEGSAALTVVPASAMIPASGSLKVRFVVNALESLLAVNRYVWGVSLRSWIPNVIGGLLASPEARSMELSAVSSLRLSLQVTAPSVRLEPRAHTLGPAAPEAKQEITFQVMNDSHCSVRYAVEIYEILPDDQEPADGGISPATDPGLVGDSPRAGSAHGVSGALGAPAVSKRPLRASAFVPDKEGTECLVPKLLYKVTDFEAPLTAAQRRVCPSFAIKSGGYGVLRSNTQATVVLVCQPHRAGLTKARVVIRTVDENTGADASQEAGGSGSKNQRASAEFYEARALEDLRKRLLYVQGSAAAISRLLAAEMERPGAGEPSPAGAQANAREGAAPGDFLAPADAAQQTAQRASHRRKTKISPTLISLVEVSASYPTFFISEVNCPKMPSSQLRDILDVDLINDFLRKEVGEGEEVFRRRGDAAIGAAPQQAAEPGANAGATGVCGEPPEVSQRTLAANKLLQTFPVVLGPNNRASDMMDEGLEDPGASGVAGLANPGDPAMPQENTYRVVLSLANPTDLECDVTFSLPYNDPNYEASPWARQLPSVDQQRAMDLLSRGIFVVSPERIVLQPGEKRALIITYSHIEEGVHELQLLCNIAGGRCFLLHLVGQTLAANEPAVLAPVDCKLYPVAVGEAFPPRQLLKLTNPGRVLVRYRVSAPELVSYERNDEEMEGVEGAEGEKGALGLPGEGRAPDQSGGAFLGEGNSAGLALDSSTGDQSGQDQAAPTTLCRAEDILQCLNPSGTLQPNSQGSLVFVFRPRAAGFVHMRLGLEIFAMDPLDAQFMAAEASAGGRSALGSARRSAGGAALRGARADQTFESVSRASLLRDKGTTPSGPELMTFYARDPFTDPAVYTKGGEDSDEGYHRVAESVLSRVRSGRSAVSGAASAVGGVTSAGGESSDGGNGIHVYQNIDIVGYGFLGHSTVSHDVLPTVAVGGCPEHPGCSSVTLRTLDGPSSRRTKGKAASAGGDAAALDSLQRSEGALAASQSGVGLCTLNYGRLIFGALPVQGYVSASLTITASTIGPLSGNEHLRRFSTGSFFWSVALPPVHPGLVSFRVSPSEGVLQPGESAAVLLEVFSGPIPVALVEDIGFNVSFETPEAEDQVGYDMLVYNKHERLPATLANTVASAARLKQTAYEKCFNPAAVTDIGIDTESRKQKALLYGVQARARTSRLAGSGIAEERPAGVEESTPLSRYSSYPHDDVLWVSVVLNTHSRDALGKYDNSVDGIRMNRAGGCTAEPENCVLWPAPQTDRGFHGQGPAQDDGSRFGVGGIFGEAETREELTEKEIADVARVSAGLLRSQLMRLCTSRDTSHALDAARRGAQRSVGVSVAYPLSGAAELATAPANFAAGDSEPGLAVLDRAAECPIDEVAMLQDLSSAVHSAFLDVEF